MRDTYVYVCEGEVSREKKKRKRLGANRGHSLKPNLSSFSFYDKVLMSLWYCWGLIQNETEFSLQHSHWWFSQPVTPSKLKWKPLNTGSLESDKWKKIYIQKASPRIRSVQYFICEIFGKNVLPKIIKLCMETPCLSETDRNICFWVFPTNVWILRLRNS